MAAPVELRDQAADDIDAAIDHYVAAGGGALALRFIDAVEMAVDRIGRYPLTGNLRFSYELGIPELRAWPIAGFPFLLFYVASDDRIDVWRVLHTRRDVPSGLVGESE
jgi:toxin ParE1/3/4